MKDHWRLRVVSVLGHGKTYPLTEARAVLGGVSGDIALGGESGASSVHAEIRFDGPSKGYIVRSLAPLAATKVNGNPVSTAFRPLGAGDLLSIGGVDLILEKAAAPVPKSDEKGRIPVLSAFWQLLVRPGRFFESLTRHDRIDDALIYAAVFMAVPALLLAAFVGMFSAMGAIEGRKGVGGLALAGVFAAPFLGSLAAILAQALLFHVAGILSRGAAPFRRSVQAVCYLSPFSLASAAFAYLAASSVATLLDVQIGLVEILSTALVSFVPRPIDLRSMELLGLPWIPFIIPVLALPYFGRALSILYRGHKALSYLLAAPLVLGVPLVFVAILGARTTERRAKPKPAAPAGISIGSIQIASATWGSSCRAPEGNSTEKVSAICAGMSSCSYYVHRSFIPDPAVGCAKDFAVEWTCGGQEGQMRAFLPAEAEGHTVGLACPPRAKDTSAQALRILSATYGANCGAIAGNATAKLASACDGTTTCPFQINPTHLGDPAVGCVKTFSAEYTCGSDPTRLKAHAGPDTNMQQLVLRCF